MWQCSLFITASLPFYNEVNGKVTGAVFKGEGHFHLEPPTAEEKHNLAIFNSSDAFDEDFDHLVLRFSDATAIDFTKAQVVKEILTPHIDSDATTLLTIFSA